MQMAGCDMRPPEIEELQAKIVDEFKRNKKCEYAPIGSNNLGNLEEQSLSLCLVEAATAALQEQQAEISTLKEQQADALKEQQAVEIKALQEQQAADLQRKHDEIQALEKQQAADLQMKDKALEKAQTDLKNANSTIQQKDKALEKAQTDLKNANSTIQQKHEALENSEDRLVTAELRRQINAANDEIATLKAEVSKLQGLLNTRGSASVDVSPQSISDIATAVVEAFHPSERDEEADQPQQPSEAQERTLLPSERDEEADQQPKEQQPKKKQSKKRKPEQPLEEQPLEEQPLEEQPSEEQQSKKPTSKKPPKPINFRQRATDHLKNLKKARK